MINMTILDFMKERAAKNGDDLAFRFLGNGDLDGPIAKWTFAELYHQSAGVAEDLAEQGLGGTSVLLAFPPGLDFVKAFYGCLLAGARAIPVPLPNPRSKNPLGRILKTAEAASASTVLTDAPLAEMVAPMVSGLPVALKPVTPTVWRTNGPAPGSKWTPWPICNSHRVPPAIPRGSPSTTATSWPTSG